MNQPVPDREQTIARVRRWLQRRSAPRLLMSSIVLATALAGFLCSFLLLQLGMRRMGMRYPFAVVFAYVFFFFLALLRLWLAHHHNRTRVKRTDDDASTGLDALDFIDSDLIPSGVTNTGAAGVDFGGGTSPSFGASLGEVCKMPVPAQGAVSPSILTPMVHGFWC